MRALTLVQSGLFTAVILGIAAAAGTRAMPFQLPERTEWLDGKLAKAFETHYDERFPARTLGMNVWAAIDYTLFHEGRAGVVVGREGWLYTDEEFKTYPDADVTVATHLALVGWVRDELARRGTQLVVALVPSKARVYPEYLDDRQPAALHAGLYARARASLLDAGIAAPDLSRALTDCKREGQAFLRTDTHWTPAGARCAARAVAAAAGAHPAGAPRYATRTETVAEHKGDLLHYLPLDPYFASLLPAPDRLEVQRTEAQAEDGGGLLGDEQAPDAVLIGTSYSADERWNLTGALQEALQEDVVNYAAKGKGPFVPMLDYLLNSESVPNPPHLVVWEIPERYLPIAQDLRVERQAQPTAGAGAGATCGADARPANDTL